MTSDHESRYWLTLTLLAALTAIALTTNLNHIHNFFTWYANLSF